MKKESKRLNIRLRQEVAWELEAISEREGISQTEVVERAILGLGSGEVKRPVNAAEGTQPVPPTVAQIAIICRHCHETFGGMKFQAPLCGECKGGGHRGMPSDCPVCTMMGTGAL